MNKAEFLKQLTVGIAGLPRDDMAHWTEYYTEMLEDRMEDGMSEEQATAALGEPAQIARQILAQTPLVKLIKNKVKPKRKLLVWEIILIALGSPVWLSLAISVAAVFFSFFVALWAGLAGIWAGGLAIAACVPASVLLFVFELCVGATAQGFLLLGGGIAAAGLSVLWYALSLCLTKLLWRLNKWFLLFVKSLFVERRAQQ